MGGWVEKVEIKLTSALGVVEVELSFLDSVSLISLTYSLNCLL